MLEKPSPQFIRGPPKQDLDSALATKLLSLASKPLKSTGQAKAGQWDFFIVGFFLGAAVYVLPAIVIGVWGVKWVVSKGGRLW
jgi:tetrahydromethanopterin S-methyltransferase subunit B